MPQFPSSCCHVHVVVAAFYLVSCALAQAAPDTGPHVFPWYERGPGSVKGRNLPPIKNPSVPRRFGVAGHQFVIGGPIDLAPLSSAVATAQCPIGKIALSAGHTFTPEGDASFGLEVRGAFPEGRTVSVRMRNANVFVSARAAAIAVCVNDIPGLRVVERELASPSNDGPTALLLTCGPDERVVGGGLVASDDTQVIANAPQSGGTAMGWQVGVSKNTPIPSRVQHRSRVLCAPDAFVDGWTFVEAAPLLIGARSQARVAVDCPTGTVLLAGGVVQRAGNDQDMLVHDLAPAGGSRWTARVSNRNALPGALATGAMLSAVCARAEPG